VTAIGISLAAGIGGGGGSPGPNCDNGGVGGTITISGGTVLAIGGASREKIEGGACIGGGAGIGGGNNSCCGTIEISGGTVVATGGDGASNTSGGAGIGGGSQGNGNDITISGDAKVMARSVSDYYGAAAIGGGYYDAVDRITIEGSAVVYAYTPNSPPDDSSNSNTGAVIGGAGGGTGKGRSAGAITIGDDFGGNPTVVAIGDTLVKNSIGPGGGGNSSGIDGSTSTVEIKGGTVIANAAIGGLNTTVSISGGVQFASAITGGSAGTYTYTGSTSPTEAAVTCLSFPGGGTIALTGTVPNVSGANGSTGCKIPPGWTLSANGNSVNGAHSMGPFDSVTQGLGFPTGSGVVP
jgi:hypothetical protein